MRTLPEIAVEDDNTRLLPLSTPINQPGKIKKGLAITAVGASVIAVVAVPYLVLRSVFYLTTHEENFTFEEMMSTDKAVFWIFGPATALLATVAIAPFNMYNAYNSIINIHLTKESLRYTAFLRTLSSFFLTFAGFVNGYNVNHAINDIWPNDSIGKQIFQYPVVITGIFFAGVSDARVFLDYVVKDVPKDWRYLNRARHATAQKIKNYFPFFKKHLAIQTTSEILHKDLLKQIRSNLDDLKMIIMLALTDSEIMQLKTLYEDRNWMTEFNSSEFEQYLNIFSKKFPSGRFFGSEIFGSAVAGLWAYYGNKNTYEYAYKAVSEFLSYCGFSAENSFLRFTSGFTSIVGYMTGLLVSFFLIRDLFFRDVFRDTSWPEFKKRLPKLLVSIIPAFSFGLLNVILTVLNVSLSPLEKVLVSCSAIIGATVVTRYGIEGGIEQIRNKPNLRRELANITDKLMEHFSVLDFDELKKINDQMSQVKNSLQTMFPKHHSREYEELTTTEYALHQ